MKRRMISLALTAAGCALIPAGTLSTATAATPGISRPSLDIPLSIGQGQLVTLPGRMAEIFTADPNVADVQARSERQAYIMAKNGGETSVYATDAYGNVIWSANIRVATNISNVGQMLNVAMPDAKVNVMTMGTNTVLLTGTVGAPEDSAEAARLVQAYMGDETNVITRLRTATPLQVNLQVKFAEVSRTLVRALGANLTTMDASGGFQFGIGQGRTNFFNKMYVGEGQTLGVGNKTSVLLPDPSNPGKFVEVETSSINTNNTGSTLGIAGKLLGLDLLGALDLAERNGLVTTLSQPNLTALSGETADFLAGGEYPIPISQGLGTTSIEYKKFGVSLAYTPTVLANGRISIRVRPEVSELSSQGAVTLNGFTVPALTIRRAETTIELGSGQSFMIAGLLSNYAQNTIDKTPGAGDLPIIGNLFKSSEFRKGQTELVIVVTPYLVNPVNANDIKLPTDGFRAPTFADQFFGNMETDGETGGDRPKPRVAPDNNNPNPAPGIGMTDDAATAPKGKKSKADRQRAEARTSAAVPGFSLK